MTDWTSTFGSMRSKLDDESRQVEEARAAAAQQTLEKFQAIQDKAQNVLIPRLRSIVMAASQSQIPAEVEVVTSSILLKATGGSTSFITGAKFQLGDINDVRGLGVLDLSGQNGELFEAKLTTTRSAQQPRSLRVPLADMTELRIDQLVEELRNQWWGKD